MFPRLCLPLLLTAVALTQAPAQDAPAYPSLTLDPALPASARNVQRTMRLLATSTPERRNTVRILFYGQSITEQSWWKIVADDLRARFPNAHLVIENRAIGGHSSQLLVKTAEADLYPFQPDLLIFHVYGAHNTYEDILRRVRERTCAEILQQNDHVTKPQDFSEEADPANLAPNRGGWDAFMNHAWLPSLARKYETAFCDQRAIWKKYLTQHNLKPSDLLRDNVHLNAHGEFLMAEIVKSQLRHDPALGPSPAEGWVKTLEIGKDANWTDGKLSVEFTGNRLDLIAKPQDGGTPVAIRIDAVKPSELAGTCAFTRTSSYPASNWPCLLKVGSQSALQPEDWVLTLHDVSPDMKSFRYDVTGSKTGPDGSGTATERFVSDSGRVVIDPGDWNFDFAMKVFKKPVPEGFQVKWKALPHARDALELSPQVQPGSERSATVAQGLTNGPHTLELTGGPDAPVAAIRIYAPPLSSK